MHLELGGPAVRYLGGREAPGHIGVPKGRGISFDKLTGRDMAVLMSQLNSELRPSLMGISPLALVRAALKQDADASCSFLAQSAS